MYTISALWTHAREGLDVTTVIFSNRSYAILAMELERVGAGRRARPGTRRGACWTCPTPPWTSPRWPPGWACPRSRATTAAEFAAGLRQALAEPGPHLIEAVLP